MASINAGLFGDNWFPKPSGPSRAPNFAFIGGRGLFFQKPKNPKNASLSASTAGTDPPGRYSQMLEQFFWECDTRPDYRHTPEVDRILAEDPVFEERKDATPEEIEENKKWWEEFRESPVVQFLRHVVEIDDLLNEMDIKKNKRPYRKEERDLWKKLPYVTGPDGRPMPRKAIRTKKEASDKFWDFARQFFFGLWAFKQRPYPPGRPIDVAQAIGHKKLERRYYDCEFRSVLTRFVLKMQFFSRL